MKYVILPVFLLVLGCAGVPENNQIVAASKSIGELGRQVDRAEKAGWIDNATEDYLINRLREANSYLGAASDVSQCPIPDDRWSCVDAILLEVEKRLMEASQ